MGKVTYIDRWTQQQEATGKLPADWEARCGGGEEMRADRILEAKWLKEARETVQWFKSLLCKRESQSSDPRIYINRG